MGVPKFYRWISERYPLINQAIDDATLLPHFDNLYLDMNGVIHGATHGDGLSKSLTDSEVMHKMFSYIDNMVKITRPRKLIYFAVDGVAPRAKMNQQRSRRFRAAKDAAEARAEAREMGEVFDDEDLFDSNQITPGTPFMARVSKQLQYYIRRRLRDDPAWRDLRIIFSGHEVPGEGEHKIVEWIRAAKSQPGWDPNTRHIMAGLDADLIMLSLAVHEPHFSLLREQIDFMGFRNSKHDTKAKTRAARHVKWQLLHIGVLREYLEMDMRPAPAALEAMPFAWDGERCVDDFVLLTALCGNDFIPHLPSLDIGEGALDELIRLYRETLPTVGGWLSERGIINFARLDPLLLAMGAMEEDTMKRRDAAMAKHHTRKQREAKDQLRLFGRVTDKMAAAAEAPAAGAADADGAMEAFLLEAGDSDDEAGWVIAGSAGVEARMRAGAVADAVASGFASVAAPAASRLLTPAQLLSGASPSAAAAAASAAPSPSSSAPSRGDRAVAAAMSSLRQSGITEDVIPVREREARASAAHAAAISSAAAEARKAAAAEAAAAGAAGAEASPAPSADGTPSAGAAAAVSLSESTQLAIARQARRARDLGRRERFYLAKFGLVIGGEEPVPEHEAVLTKLRRCFGEALQWVMLYYYQGCPSWGWFFPFHYSPMVSDLVGMGDLGPYSFELGKPFRPFQQLLGCLPAASAKFLPPSYRRLMVSSDSPLLDFYPDVASIRVDMDGKKNPWEGVTIIPFIREQRMLKAIADLAPDSTLTPDELKRNSYGKPYDIVRDVTATETLPSPLLPPLHLIGTPEAASFIRASDFPDVTRCRSRQTVHVQPSLPPTGFEPLPPVGCVVPAPGYPTLHSLPLAPVRAPVEVNIFGFSSRKDSVVMAVSEHALASGYIRSEVRPSQDTEAPYILAVPDDPGSAAADGAAAGSEGAADELAPPSSAAAAAAAAGAFAARPLSDAPATVVPHTPSFSVHYTATTCARPPEQALAAIARAVSGEFSRGDSAAGSEGADDELEIVPDAPLSLHAGECTANEAASLVGTVAYASWPHLTPVMVTAVSDAKGEVSRDAVTGEVVARSWPPERRQAWLESAQNVASTLLSGSESRRLLPCGIAAGPVSLLVRVAKLVGMTRDPVTGNLSRTFAAPGSIGELLIPGQLLLANHPNPDPRFNEVSGRSPVDRFRPGHPVVVLSGPHQGEAAIVIARDLAAGTLSLATAGGGGVEPAFGVALANIDDRYFPTHEAAALAGISPGTFGQLAGTVKVGRSRDNIDIGLNLRVRKDLFLPGYARPRGAAARQVAWLPGSNSAAALASAGRGGRGGGGRGDRDSRSGGAAIGWEFTLAAVQLVQSYAERFPAVVAAIDANPSARWLEIHQVGGGPQLEAILTWKGQVATANRPLVTTNTSVMSARAMALLEGKATELGSPRVRGLNGLMEAAEAAAAAGAEPGAAARAALQRLSDLGCPAARIDGVAPSDVFAREDEGYAVGDIGGGEGMATAGASGDDTPVLGARICNLAEARAPLGMRGVVVAVHGSTGYVEVLWDAPVDGGSTLNGLCSPGRGALLRWNTVMMVPTVGRAPAPTGSATPSIAARAQAATPGAWEAKPAATPPSLAAALKKQKRKAAAAKAAAAKATEPVPAPAPAAAPAAGGAPAEGRRVMLTPSALLRPKRK
ncbi:hypothetical protein FNF31_03480 [Cafeteria roenbergensis]|uniref:Uncharacterized protein n=1 Tax=Cafeteria roenbergensis TaxID=33653 RepID=A0A5A8DAY3_CAFRO|nr:hypothetical protein FNF31_03480 [Cafeteria roenbergensis]